MMHQLPRHNDVGLASATEAVTGNIFSAHSSGEAPHPTSSSPNSQYTPPLLLTPGLAREELQNESIAGTKRNCSPMSDNHQSTFCTTALVADNGIHRSGIPHMSNTKIEGGTVTGCHQSRSPDGDGQCGDQGRSVEMDAPRLPPDLLDQSSLSGPPGGRPSLQLPLAALYPSLQHVISEENLRFPVLRPLLPHISGVIPIRLACDLLEFYFSSNTLALHPQSPYVLGYFVRKRSFLRQQQPRSCSPALLASMLWVAAQTSGSPSLTSPPSARGKICQELLELTLGLLRPIFYTTPDGVPVVRLGTAIDGVRTGGLRISVPGQAHMVERASNVALGQLDALATCIHLGTVSSAGEHKAASLKWWTCAWSLAKEMQLGREVPKHSSASGEKEVAGGEIDVGFQQAGGKKQSNKYGNRDPIISFSEEQKEERRRVWWLLYIVDRHLALCYNRPLYLLDSECDDLLQPENDEFWQKGDFYPSENRPATIRKRKTGPTFECTAHGIFGCFLPLMTILGQIIDLNHTKASPHSGFYHGEGIRRDAHLREIVRQMDAYKQGLKALTGQSVVQPGHENKQMSSGPGKNDAGYQRVETGPSRSSTETSSGAILQIRTAVAYGTYLIHAFHILVNGRWDPITLLSDNDLWTSSQSFASAANHALSAADAIDEILHHDPDLSFMPFFFGIFLLQSSFLLLLIADRLPAEVNARVARACETSIRAHEVCIVTLNTEYQRSFRKVMLASLAKMQGRVFDNPDERQLRRREVLGLYRWTDNGTGLAM